MLRDLYDATTMVVQVQNQQSVPMHLHRGVRFADDIVIVAETVQDLQYMLNSPADSSARIGLRMNQDKTKVLFNEHVLPDPIILNGSPPRLLFQCLWRRLCPATDEKRLIIMIKKNYKPGSDCYIINKDK